MFIICRDIRSKLKVPNGMIGTEKNKTKQDKTKQGSEAGEQTTMIF